MPARPGVVWGPLARRPVFCTAFQSTPCIQRMKLVKTREIHFNTIMLQFATQLCDENNVTIVLQSKIALRATGKLTVFYFLQFCQILDECNIYFLQDAARCSRQHVASSTRNRLAWKFSTFKVDWMVKKKIGDAKTRQRLLSNVKHNFLSVTEIWDVCKHSPRLVYVETPRLK